LQDIGRIFSNIIDIYEFSVTFLGLLEAAIEVADEGKQPAIGECFEEMAEVKAFLTYTVKWELSFILILWSKEHSLHEKKSHLRASAER